MCMAGFHPTGKSVSGADGIQDSPNTASCICLQAALVSGQARLASAQAQLDLLVQQEQHVAALARAASKCAAPGVY